MKKAGLIAISLLAFLSACTASTGATPSPSIQAEQLRVVTMFGGNDPHYPVFMAHNETFYRETGVRVLDNSANADENWKNGVINDFAAGNEPDVLYYFIGIDAQPLIENGKVVDIATIRQEYADYGTNILPEVYEMTRAYDGKNYIVPPEGFWEALYCNRALFQKHGVALPEDWDSFLHAVDVFSREGIVPVSVALGDVPHYWIENLILAMGGAKEHNANPVRGEPAPESWEKALALFQTLYKRGAFPEDTNWADNAAMERLFLRGEAAMRLDGSWFAGAIENAKDQGELEATDIALCPLPVPPGGKGTGHDLIYGYTSGWYITKKAWDDTVKREAAVRFVQHQSSEASLRAYYEKAAGSVPTIAIENNNTPLREQTKALLGGAAELAMPIDSVMQKEAWTALVQGIPNLTTGQTDAQTLLRQVSELNWDTGQ